MATATYDADRDLREAKAMADALIPYVYEEPLYGSIRGGLFGSGTMPALTIGSLLMRVRRLRALEFQLTPTQRTQLEQVEREHEAGRAEWRTHYMSKLNREGLSRIKAMSTFFEECEDAPRNCSSIYLPEVLRRTVVQEIKRALDLQGEMTEDLTKAIRSIDAKLRRFTQPSNFLWPSVLEVAYPPSEYWWLYARPPVAERDKV